MVTSKIKNIFTKPKIRCLFTYNIMITHLLRKSWFKKAPIFFNLLFVFAFSACDLSSSIKVETLKTKYRSNPLGIDDIAPRLSWQLIDESHTRDQQQTAYQVLVANSLIDLEDNVGDVWNSGKVTSDQSVNVVYKGAELQSSKQYFWKVRVWDVANQSSEWSKPTHFSMGLLKPSDWKGDWIYKNNQNKKDHNWYRKNFTLDENSGSAFIHVASFGYHEVYVNGKKVSNAVMNPVYSFVKKRLPYLTYNIKEHLKKVDNVIGI